VGRCSDVWFHLARHIVGETSDSFSLAFSASVL